MTDYNTIIPEEWQMELLLIADNVKEHAWRIGDITNEVIRFYKNVQDEHVSKMDIYAAVGSFCGLSSRTVRYYANVAQKIPPEMRHEYDVLSFAHFAAAVSNEDPKKALDYAVDSFDVSGRPATVDEIIREFSTRNEVKVENELKAYMLSAISSLNEVEKITDKKVVLEFIAKAKGFIQLAIDNL